jgi:hypothetical protein
MFRKSCFLWTEDGSGRISVFPFFPYLILFKLHFYIGCAKTKKKLDMVWRRDDPSKSNLRTIKMPTVGKCTRVKVSTVLEQKVVYKRIIWYGLKVSIF